MSKVSRSISALVACCILFIGAPPTHSSELNLPDIGTDANVTISLDDEYRLGSMAMREIRNQGQVLEDPEVSEYLNNMGNRLASFTQSPTQKFQFFLVKEGEINAFALPGGFIGINAGLLLATHNESELAGVIAHEISHVTQRHFAHAIAAQSRNNVVSTAALLASIMLGASGSPDAAIAGISAAQSIALNNQMSFSRDNESDADNVGIRLVSRAGYDPNGMWQFFEVLQQEHGTVAESDIPSILRSHPVTIERIAETRSRAKSIEVPNIPDSTTYEMMRERIRVLMTPASESPLQYYQDRTLDEKSRDIPRLYGKALAHIYANQSTAAIQILSNLQAQHPTVMQIHTALGQAYLANHQAPVAITTLERANALFPRNVPVTVRYAEALLQAGNSKLAHAVLLDLFNNVLPSSDQMKLIAKTANLAGESAEAYYYMTEYYVMNDELPLAVTQLQMALSVPELTSIQRARFQARLGELQEIIRTNKRKYVEQVEGNNRAPRLST